MCLLTRQKEPIILKEDKVVWKELKVLENSLFSIFMDFEWILNKKYETNICITGEAIAYDDKQIDMYMGYRYELLEGVISISQGFHAFSDFNYAIKDSKRLNRELFECIIPAGSEYYEDVTGLCVSNQIIIVKQLD